MIEIVDQTRNEGLNRALIRISGLEETAKPGELRLRFEFDVSPPKMVLIVGDSAEDPRGSGWRRGPAVWRLPVTLLNQELRIEWLSPRSGARLAEARFATTKDDDRPDKFFDDLQAVLACHRGVSSVERDRRFFLELDFATTLMRSNYLQGPNKRAAIDKVGIPEEVFDILPSNVEYDLQNIVTDRPFARGFASLPEGNGAILDRQRVDRRDVVDSISKIFRALAQRHYRNGSNEWPHHCGMAFLRFANGSLRRTPRVPTESESARAFNCQPDGYFFLSFAEFALEARKTCPPVDQELWDSLLPAMVAGIEVYGDVYWDRQSSRRANVYSPDVYQQRRGWRDEDLDALFGRILALPDKQFLSRWGQTLVNVLIDEPLLYNPPG